MRRLLDWLERMRSRFGQKTPEMGTVVPDSDTPDSLKKLGNEFRQREQEERSRQAEKSTTKR
jgi:hypothetical protein